MLKTVERWRWVIHKSIFCVQLTNNRPSKQKNILETERTILTVYLASLSYNQLSSFRTKLYVKNQHHKIWKVASFNAAEKMKFRQKLVPVLITHSIGEDNVFELLHHSNCRWIHKVQSSFIIWFYEFMSLRKSIKKSKKETLETLRLFLKFSEAAIH